ncbi:hypothetical protein JCM3774_004040 [Rhodotorula dairenensis]
MDLSAGGLAPDPRNGDAPPSSLAAAVDPLEGLLDPLRSPLNSPRSPAGAAARAAMKALAGADEPETVRQSLETKAKEERRRRRQEKAAPPSVESVRGHVGSSSGDFHGEGSAGKCAYSEPPRYAVRPTPVHLSGLPEADLQPAGSASKSRRFEFTYPRKTTSRYFEAPAFYGRGAGSQEELAARGFQGGNGSVDADRGHSTLAAEASGDDLAVSDDASVDRKDTPHMKQEHYDTGSGPSQLGGGLSKRDFATNKTATATDGGRRFTLTRLRHMARLDQYANEEGRYSPAPESAFSDAPLRGGVEVESEHGGSGSLGHGDKDLDSTRSVQSGDKRVASEMEGGKGDEEEEEEAARRNRYRRSDTPFTESESPGDDAASFVTSEAPSRTYSGRRRSRSVVFSQYSLYSERSRDDHGYTQEIDAHSEKEGDDDFGFHTGAGGAKPIVIEADENEAGDRLDDQDEVAEPGHYIDFDPLMPMSSIYVGTKHPYLAHAAALAQAAKDAEETARADAPQQQQEQQQQGDDQENVAPPPPAGSLGPDQATEPEPNAESILEQWQIARAGAVERFGELMNKVDQLLDGKVKRHEQLDSTLTTHQTTLNERFKQLQQTKVGLSQWGGQLFTSLKQAEQETTIGDDDGDRASGTEMQQQQAEPEAAVVEEAAKVLEPGQKGGERTLANPIGADSGPESEAQAPKGTETTTAGLAA